MLCEDVCMDFTKSRQDIFQNTPTASSNQKPLQSLKYLDFCIGMHDLISLPEFEAWLTEKLGNIEV